MKQDIYYNQKIIWMNDWLITKSGLIGDGKYRPHRILSYGSNSFYVKTDKTGKPDVTIIDTAGNFIDRLWKVPEDDNHRTPLWRYTLLTNAYTGKEGFLKR